MIGPKPIHDHRVVVKILCDGALRSFEQYDPIVSEISFLNLARMVDHMYYGGYRSHYDDNGIGIEDVNTECIALLTEMKFDHKSLISDLLLLSKPSPFTVDEKNLEEIKVFLHKLINRLNENSKYKN